MADVEKRNPERDLTCMSFSVIDDIRGEALEVVFRFSWIRHKMNFCYFALL